MPKKSNVIIFLLLITSITAIGILIHGVSSKNDTKSQGDLATNAALGLKDTTPVVWVNDREIPRGTLVGAANTVISTEGLSGPEAYQKALNLIVQKSLFLQAAVQRGLFPTDAEVEARVQESLAAAGEDEQLREIYIAQASALGMKWDSPEFKAYLFEQHREYFPVEKLNRQIRDQAGDDDAEYNRLKAGIIEEMYAVADILVDFDTLPEEAGNIHIPGLSELPMMIAANGENQPSPLNKNFLRVGFRTGNHALPGRA